MKKQIAQNVEPHMVEMASGYTTNTRPGPSLATSCEIETTNPTRKKNDFVREQVVCIKKRSIVCFFQPLHELFLFQTFF